MLSPPFLSKNGEISFITFHFFNLLSNLVNLTHYTMNNSNTPPPSPQKNPPHPEAVKDISLSSFKHEEKKSINKPVGERKMNVSIGNIVTIVMSK